jgi:predicted acylesterase/phospholipase RssA
MVYDTLVLAGGGVKGLVLLGAIQTLTDSKKLEAVNTYVGTSVGAIIGYFLAIGYTPVEIIALIYCHKWLDKLQDLNLMNLINGNGVLSFAPIQEALEFFTLTKIGKFLTLKKLEEEYGKKLVCCTYNMTTCKPEYLSAETHPDLPCLTALRMSANIPLVFDRFSYTNNFYIDGGIVDNFPIGKGIELGKSVIGINMKVDEKSLADSPEDGVVPYFFRLLQVPIIQSVEFRNEKITKECLENGKVCKILTIRSGELKASVGLNVPHKTRFEMFSEGYQQAKTLLLSD